MLICDKNTSVTVTSQQNRNCIYETVKRIDQLQKEVLLENNCVGCEGSLFSRLYNTKPVSFILCGGARFEAQLSTAVDAPVTTIFRIQEIFDEISKTHRKIIIMGKQLQDIINMSLDKKYLTINKQHYN